MSTAPNNAFAKLTDQEIQNLIIEVFGNISVALEQLQGVWKTPAGLQVSNHYRQTLKQGAKDLESLLAVWNYRQESMR